MCKFRLKMLGVLCAGLLLAGVGIGVGFAEFSSFTYAGERVPEQAQSCTTHYTFPLDGDRVFFSSYLFNNQELNGRMQMNRDAGMQKGTLLLEIEYNSVGPEPTVWRDTHEEEEQQVEEIGLGWNYRSDLSILLSFKDQILKDVQNHQIGDYIPAEVTRFSITVHPDDAAKIQLT